MGIEQPINYENCIDETPIQELANRNEGELTPEKVQNLLEEGYQVDYDIEKDVYKVTTYLGSKKYDVGLSLSKFEDGGINAILLKLVRDNTNIFTQDTYKKGMDKYQEQIVVIMLGGEYQDYMLFKNGILSTGAQPYNESTPDTHLQSGIDYLLESGSESGYSSETMEALKSTTIETVLQDFHHEELENFLHNINVHMDMSFEQRREEYLKIQEKQGKGEICDHVGIELEKLNGEIKNYEIAEGLEGLSLLTDFLENNDFKKITDGKPEETYSKPHPGENMYTDSQGLYTFIFLLEENGEKLLWENIEVHRGNEIIAFNIFSKTHFQDMLNQMN